MNTQTYFELSDRTCKHVESMTMNAKDYDLMHATLGIASESGEIVDAVKKNVIYGKDLDVANMHEEIGDLMWYIALVCRTLDFNMEDIMQANISKLRKRYPEKYSNVYAVKRLDKVEDTIKD